MFRLLTTMAHCNCSCFHVP